MSSLYHFKINVTFKITLNENLIVIYHKFNDNFKSHINFERIQRVHEFSF
jgi:hypothetical protein